MTGTTQQTVVTKIADKTPNTTALDTVARITKVRRDLVTIDADSGGANGRNQGKNSKAISTEGFIESNRTAIFAVIALVALMTCCCVLCFIRRKHRKRQRKAIEEAAFGLPYSPNNKFSTVQYIVEDEGDQTPYNKNNNATISDLFSLAYDNTEQQRIHSSTIMEGALSSNAESDGDEGTPEIDI